jgi:hypothetical protein
MKEDEFLKQMENLKVPDVKPGEHQQIVKMAVMNAERSAALGVWLIVLPCYFLLCVFMYYHFHMHISWFEAMYKLVLSLDKTPHIDFLGPLILVVLPIICIIINALAITHVSIQKYGPGQSKVNEFNISIRLKGWNILLILVSLAILCIFISFAMTENISIKN